MLSGFFFFNNTATTEIYTLPLHDALPISLSQVKFAGDRIRHSDLDAFLLYSGGGLARSGVQRRADETVKVVGDRKSTRLNSSHANISYAVFCLKKNNKKTR